jgi:hypothetical protein
MHVVIHVVGTQLITRHGCSTHSKVQLRHANAIDTASVDASYTLMWACPACPVLAVPKVWYPVSEPGGLASAYQPWKQHAQGMQPTCGVKACMHRCTPAATAVAFNAQSLLHQV